MVEHGVAFEFKFKPLTMKHGSLEYRVCTDRRDYMDMFLKQHNFNMETSHVNIIGFEDFDSEAEDTLKPFVFRSNATNEQFVVITTERFVSDAIDEVCSMLSDASLFNDVMFRSDTELIDTVTELINSLTFGVVINHTLMTDDGEFISNDWERYTKAKKMYNTDGWEHPVGDDYLYEMMYEVYNSSLSLSKPQPITIESYIRSFRETLTDEY